MDSRSNEFPNFAQTVMALISYMMVAPEKHPYFIPAEAFSSDDPTSNHRTLQNMFTSKPPRIHAMLRVSQHYATTLVECGLPAAANELQWIVRWFGEPLPEQGDSVIDTTRLTKLDGLLTLQPEHPFVQPLLQQLVRQRTDEYLFSIPSPNGNTSRVPAFSTLWALKVLMQARRSRVLNGLISVDDMNLTLRSLWDRNTIALDKDYALALGVFYELNGTLDNFHETKLKELLKRATDNSDLWGAGRRRNQREIAREISVAIHRCRVTPDLIERHEEPLREIVTNTCYVIENLMPLAKHYPEVDEAVRSAIHPWWKLFEGPDAPDKISALFPTEYDYLIALCRTLLAIRSYTQISFKDLYFLQALRDEADRFREEQIEHHEVLSIQAAVRGWLRIDLDEHGMDSLDKGYSGSKVVRIHPEVQFRVKNGTETAEVLSSSLIVKYGERREVELERENYLRLPDDLRHHFVEIPEKPYVDDRRQLCYIIMQDLHDFLTMEEAYYKMDDRQRRAFPKALIEFLQAIHVRSGPPRFSESRHYRYTYVIPMLEDLTFVRNTGTQIRNAIGPVPVELLNRIEQMLDQMVQAIVQLEPFPLMLMHGDLHTRNIMVRVNSSDFTFKLIDLEKVQTEGDPAHDIGQLLSDIELELRSRPEQIERKKTHTKFDEQVKRMQQKIIEGYLRYAFTHDDLSFGIRLDLARARALIRIGKGRFKRAQRFVRLREYDKAQELTSEAVALLEDIEKYLQEVSRHLHASI